MSERLREEKDTDSEPSDMESDYDLDIDHYQPIRPIGNEHGVMLVSTKLAKFNFHHVQCMHHGVTAIHWEEDSSRSSICYLKLENTNGTLSWSKPNWSALRGSSTPDYILKGDFDALLSPGLSAKYSVGEQVSEGLEEGYIELHTVKEVNLGGAGIDLNLIARRHSLTELSQQHNVISILYGLHLSDNRLIHFILPKNCAQVWFSGLQSLVKATHRQKRQTDQRTQWLKEQFLQLYYEGEKCQGPTPAEAIKVRSRSLTCKVKGQMGSMWFIYVSQCHISLFFNPFNAEATFDQSSRIQRVLKTLIITLSCWYSLDCSLSLPVRINSDEYPYARVLIIFQVICIILYWQN